MLPKIIILGPFPPPLHGFSQANLAMRAKFEEAGFSVVSVDTASPDRSLSRIISRSRALARVAMALAGSNSWLYLPVSGGNGQLADLVGILLARLFRRPIILHHHSFAYLNRFSPLADLLFRAAGGDARHIVLGDGMKAELARQYAAARQIMVLSNASLTPVEADEGKDAGKQFTIGFLSNITLDKGIDRFVALHAQLQERGTGVAAVIAGPIVDADASSAVERARTGGAQYRGAVSGESKTAFFRSIDVLVFPTRYANEAEPFVILEALASGTPVIASRRGCIATLLDDSCGMLLDASAEDITPAIKLIMRWAADAATYQSASSAASDRFAEIRRRSDKQLGELLVEMANAL